jgi:REP element-mobilizing transposase RayT
MSAGLSWFAMPRLPRSTFPEYGVWHATTRGVERRKVYLDRHDGREFLVQLWRAVDRFRLDVYALCLMPNHYHFVVECPRELLSRALHRVNGLYAEAFNARYRRSGHLWGDRFALWQVRDEEHLEATCAYVLANLSGPASARTQMSGRGAGAPIRARRRA